MGSLPRLAANTVHLRSTLRMRPPGAARVSKRLPDDTTRFRYPLLQIALSVVTTHYWAFVVGSVTVLVFSNVASMS